jgi:putative peptidoglycan lipid II flippase
MAVSIASVLVNAVAAFTMVRVAGFGLAGLALTTSVVSTFSALTLLVLLQARIGGLQGKAILIGLLKIGIAAALMGGVCHAVVAASHALLHAPGLARLADVVIGIPAGLGSFYAVAAALHVPELANTRAELLRKFHGGSSV